jgi:hypothetical protein
MVTDTLSSVCGKHLSVLKEISHNPSLTSHSTITRKVALQDWVDRGLESNPRISLAHIAESKKNVTEESVNVTPANVSKLEIAAFKRVMWQWQETNEAAPQKASKEPKEFTTNIPADSGDSFGTTNEEDHHSLVNPLHCTCGRSSSRSEAELQKHKLDHHQVQWRCSVSCILVEDDSVAPCGETFSKESEFGYHMAGHGIWEKTSQDQAVRDLRVQDEDLLVQFENHNEVESPPLPPKLELDPPLVESFLQRRKRHGRNELFNWINPRLL